MSPLVTTIAEGALTAIFLVAFIAAGWANSRMTRRAILSKYSLFNPMSAIAAWKGIEFPLFIAAVLVAVGAAMALKALR